MAGFIPQQTHTQTQTHEYAVVERSLWPSQESVVVKKFSRLPRTKVQVYGQPNLMCVAMLLWHRSKARLISRVLQYRCVSVGQGPI
jgi:hypothetical protein